MASRNRATYRRKREQRQREAAKVKREPRVQRAERAVLAQPEAQQAAAQ